MISGRRPVGFRLLLTLLLAALALGGCSDDDDDDNPFEPEPTPTYPILSHPYSVLEALELAYSRLDITQYKALHDSAYTGQSVDLNDPGNDIDLTFPDEARHIAALASTPGLTAYLDLGPPETWERIASDDPSHPEWAIIQIAGSGYRIEVFDGANALGANGEPGTFLEFAFTPTLDSTSPSDTLWRIVRWREVGNSTPESVP